jgi:diguanylate cyclase (GGDEF)-like protein
MAGLVEAATVDTLTGLASRSEFQAVLDAVQAGDALVLLDLDCFKEFNDRQGHQAGDELLADFGRAIGSVLRSSDIAVRYGGDEVMILASRAGSDGADALLSRLARAWEEQERPTFSAGVAVRADEQPAETLHRADKALYSAKAAGRDHWSHAAARDTMQLRVVR